MPASVAIITRTKDRPILLERAASSVAGQTYSNCTWVVVNDGGNEAAARAVIEQCSIAKDRILFLSNGDSLGMEAASNIGIRSSESDYIVILDDDDTLHPEFVEATVGFLESEAGQIYGGVATKVERVSEQIIDDQIIIHDRQPFMSWVNSIDFAEMLAQNTITSNSFLYRRALFSQIGGYNEGLPVLGDWFFNIEFLLHTDIKLLPRVLSYYHHRDVEEFSGKDAYANSVFGEINPHYEHAARCRNALIRKYRNESGIAAAIVSGYFAHMQRHPNQRSKDWAEQNGLQLQEFDRIWVLSQILSNKKGAWRLLGRSRSQINHAAPLLDLALLAKQRRIDLVPPLGFDEVRYLKDNPDVAAEVGKGGFSSGYAHYVLNGFSEGRTRPGN